MMHEPTTAQTTAQTAAQTAASRPPAAMLAAALLGLALLAAPPAGSRSLDGHGGSCEGDEQVSCISCAIFARYDAALTRAQLDVGAIPDGLVMHFTADRPEIVVDLQRFAFERQRLHGQFDHPSCARQLCSECRQRMGAMRDARYEVANSAHGVFAVLTSDDAAVVNVLHDLAAEMAIRNDVRGSSAVRGPEDVRGS